jgi:transcriptional regulator with XRE-family HTH domain
MICDGTKVASLREKLCLTQEKLAAQSNVDPQTIQRMEAGEAVRVETLNSVAAPLGVTGPDLLRSSDDASHEGPADGSGILLKPERSGQRLVAAVLRADHLVLGAVFEPWPEQMRVVQPLLAALERLHPPTFFRPSDFEWRILVDTTRQMEEAAQMNDYLVQLGELKPEGLHVLTGQCTVRGQRTHRHTQKDYWFKNPDDPRDEVLRMTVVRIAPVSTKSLRIPLPSIPPWSILRLFRRPQESAPTTGGPNWDDPHTATGGDLDDEIPF